MRDAYIIQAVRTPVGKAYKGALRHTRPDELGAIAIREAVARVSGLDVARVDDVIMGCAMPEAEQGLNVARIASLRAGMPVTASAMTVNRFCASGLQAIHFASARIMLGEAQVVVAGGLESMSMIPMSGNRVSLHLELAVEYPEVYISMGNTAERVAEKYNVTRADQDRFALASHQKAARALAEGRFRDEIVPVTVTEKSINAKNKIEARTLTFDTDEGVRADTSLEALAGLKPAFKVDGTVTAGNASQMSDGAAALVVVSEDVLGDLGIKPLGKLVAYATAGVEPDLMGIGPVFAVPKALRMAGLSMDDIALVELNEAFASQAAYVQRELGIPDERLNVSGGAIALGHPLGCTGAKLATTLLHEMQRRRVEYGVVTMCVGGGMGAAGVFQRIDA
ncbi:MAG: thiolase family protein [Candidatus Krumholzibacteria bacterium]|nr:thiolase family protein [Candidatus Krumholzibacteria bacterium]